STSGVTHAGNLGLWGRFEGRTKNGEHSVVGHLPFTAFLFIYLEKSLVPLSMLTYHLIDLDSCWVRIWWKSGTNLIWVSGVQIRRRFFLVALGDIPVNWGFGLHGNLDCLYPQLVVGISLELGYRL